MMLPGRVDTDVGELVDGLACGGEAEGSGQVRKLAVACARRRA